MGKCRFATTRLLLFIAVAEFILILINAARSLDRQRGFTKAKPTEEPGMYKKIVVPVAMDQMERGEQILKRAMELLGEGGEIVLVHVIEDVTGYMSIEFPAALVETEIKLAEERLTKLQQDLGVSGKIDIRYGGSARQILAAAEEHKADLIIIASHRPGLANYLLGATADRVVRHSPISVLVDR